MPSSALPPRRVTIATFGSRGDVQPYVALGLGLRAAGHAVRLATYGIYERFVRDRGLDFAPVAGDPSRGFGLGGRGDPRIDRLDDFMSLLLSPRFVAECLDACRDADVVVASQSGGLVAHHVAERLRVPIVLANYVPLGLLARRGPLAPLVRSVGRQVLWLRYRAATNRARREALGLPPLPLRSPFGAIERRRHLTLYGYSPAVVPRPADWGPWVQVTGYWFLDRPADWRPPADLVAFLGAGPPPVYVGFAGARDPDPTATRRLVLAALAAAGQRGVVAVEGGAVGPLGPDAFGVADVPFDWLFPRLAAVVHHGGAGTTAAGLRAGRPTVVVPSFADQPLWGRRVWELGVGPRPIPRRHLSVAGLAAAVRAAVGEPEMGARAAALGDRIRAEDGVARAVEAFERYLADGRAAG